MFVGTHSQGRREAPTLGWMLQARWAWTRLDLAMTRWKDTTLGEFVALQCGHDLTEPERRMGNVPVMGSAGQNGFHDTSLARPGHRDWTKRCLIRPGAFLPVDYWPHNTALYVTDFKGNDPRFAFYFLKALDFDRFNSDSAQPSLNRNFIYPIPVRIPPLAEQKAIAAVLGALDDKIELNRRMNATLEAMVRALFQSWFVDFDPVRAKLDGRQPFPPQRQKKISRKGAKAPKKAAARRIFAPLRLCVTPPPSPPFSPPPSKLRGRSHPERLAHAARRRGRRMRGRRNIEHRGAEVLGRRHTPLDDTEGLLLAPSAHPPRHRLQAHRRRYRQDFLRPASHRDTAAFLPRPSRLPRHLRHARRHQSGFHRHEVQRARLQLLHVELGPDEHGRDRKARHRHHFAEISKQNFRPIRVVLPPKELMPPSLPRSRRSTPESPPTSTNHAPSPPCATRCCRS